MSMENILQRLRIAELAIAHQIARRATAAAKYDYHLAWKRHETGDENYGTDDGRHWVSHDERICKNSPQFEEACIVTKAEHEIYKAAKRAEYNIKRRLENAIRSIS